jgi:SAM-dependent methyltransferase
MAGDAGAVAAAWRVAGARPGLRLRLVCPLGGRRGCGLGDRRRCLGADARARPDDDDDASIRYPRADLEAFEPAPHSVDLVHSSLAFHYIEKLDRLFGAIHQALSPGGRLVFSVEHPIFTAPSAPGWTVDGAGRKVWPVDGYQIEGPRTTRWLGRDVVKQHRTVGTYVTLLLRAGFTIDHLEEWAPTLEQVEARPDWAEERQRPTFMLMAAQI